MKEYRYQGSKGSYSIQLFEPERLATARPLDALGVPPFEIRGDSIEEAERTILIEIHQREGYFTDDIKRDRNLYVRLLTEIRWRVGVGFRMCEPPFSPDRIESAAVQLREVLELIVFGSVVNNRAAIETIATAFANSDVKQARKLAKRANPKYWPQGLTRLGAPEALRPDQLAENEWGRAYGFASDLLHAHSPYLPPIDYVAKVPELEQWFRKIIALLEFHRITLPNKTYSLRGEMSPNGVWVFTYKAIDPRTASALANELAAKVEAHLKAGNKTYRVPADQVAFAEMNVHGFKRFERVAGDSPDGYYLALPGTPPSDSPPSVVPCS